MLLRTYSFNVNHDICISIDPNFRTLQQLLYWEYKFFKTTIVR
jgi:hypothetical protein